jgi:hypothetical protein
MAVTVDGEKGTDELEPFDPLLAPGAPAPPRKANPV